MLEAAVSWLLGRAEAEARALAQGAAYDVWRRETRRRIAVSLRDMVGAAPKSAPVDDPLSRVAAIAVGRAGKVWLRDLADRAPERNAADQKAMAAFITRTDAFLTTCETKGQAGGVIDPALARLIADAAPGAEAGETDAALTRRLADLFRAALETRDGGDALPAEAADRLTVTDAAGLNIFGRDLLNGVVSLLQSGDYADAAQAFDRHVGAEIRAALGEMAAELGDVRKTLTLRLDSVAWAIDRNEALLKEIRSAIDARSHLALDRKPAEADADAETFLALAFNEKRTAFVGRDAEEAALRAFLTQPAGFSWWQIAGDGGAGKSRLALELIEQTGHAWRAGFLSSETLSDTDWKTIPFADPTLIVIDYVAAATKAARFVDIVRTLRRRDRQDSGPGFAPLGAPVRLLAVERVGYDLTRETPGDWLRSVAQQPQKLNLLKRTAHEPQALTLPELDRAALSAVIQSWRKRTGRDEWDAATEAELLDHLFDEQASRKQLRRPLFTMMLASGLSAAVDATTILDILDRTLAAEEERYWIDAAGAPLSPRIGAIRLACLAAWSDGFDPQRDLPILIEGYPDAAAFYGWAEAAVWPEAWMAAGYRTMRATATAMVPGRTPDLLAEAFLIRQLNRVRYMPTADIATLARHAAYIAPFAYLEATLRLDQDFPDDRVTEILAEAQSPFSANLMLLAAGEAGDAVMLQAALDAGASPNWIEPRSGIFPLIMAAQNGHVACVVGLLSAGAEPNTVHRPTMTFPLLQAAANGHAGCVAELLAHNAAPDKVNNKDGTFPLLIAAENGHYGCVVDLLANDAHPNKTNKENGAFPLLQAAQEGHERCVEALLAKAADPNKTNDENGIFALLMAAENGHRRCVAKLLASNANPDKPNDQNGTRPLIQAAQYGCEGCVVELLANHADPNIINKKNGSFPLLQAAQEGHERCVSDLLDSNADPNKTNKMNGNFPLLAAVQNEHEGCVAILLANQAEPGKTDDENGIFPLLLAVAKKRPDIVRLLLEYGADVAQTYGQTDYTAQNVASALDDKEIAAILLAAMAARP